MTEAAVADHIDHAHHAEPALPELWSLTGRCAVVTGAGQGIGATIAARLAEAGAAIVAVDINGATVQATVERLADRYGGATIAVQADVADPQAAPDIVAAALELTGRLDIWVNNAGICRAAALSDLSAEEWDLTHNVDLRGAFLGAKQAAQTMIANGTPGVIINVASVAGVRGRARHVHYSAAKHGVIGLTKSLGVELGPRGIRVMAIAPTVIATPGQMARAAQLAAEDEAAKAVEDSIISTIALGRLGTPDDVARVALFLASDMAAFVSGSTVFVDGASAAL